MSPPLSQIEKKRKSSPRDGIILAQLLEVRRGGGGLAIHSKEGSSCKIYIKDSCSFKFNIQSSSFEKIFLGYQTLRPCRPAWKNWNEPKKRERQLRLTESLKNIKSKIPAKEGWISAWKTGSRPVLRTMPLSIFPIWKYESPLANFQISGLLSPVLWLQGLDTNLYKIPPTILQTISNHSFNYYYQQPFFQLSAIYAYFLNPRPIIL